MQKMRFVWLSLIGFVVALGLGSGAYLGVHGMQKNACGYSQAATLALGMTAGPSHQEIEKLDAAFGQAFGQACHTLCMERAALSEKLLSAKLGDSDVIMALEKIQTQQARMEQMTWDHIIAVRDLLPPGQRENYIHQVQKNWAAGQARLRSVSTMKACPMQDMKTQ